jgi:hypothetical protein
MIVPPVRGALLGKNQYQELVLILENCYQRPHCLLKVYQGHDSVSEVHRYTKSAQQRQLAERVCQRIDGQK